MEQTHISNQSGVQTFILLGLTDFPHVQLLLLILLLGVYIFSMLGNLAILCIILTDSHLHTAMYFFLSNLSFLETCFISVTVPKMLASFQRGSNSITFHCCFVQIYFLHFFGATECFVLCFMAYDRFVAICYPLRYSALLTLTVCLQMVALSWCVGFLDAVLHTVLTSQLHFCHLNELLNFFCDIPNLFQISCSDTTVNEIVLRLCGVIIGLSTAVVIVISYIYIIATILSIKTSEGKWKLFSTCSSHLLVVTLFYSTTTFTYIRNNPKSPVDNGSIISLCYSVVTPCLNPIIYSLRNKEVQAALKIILQKISFSHHHPTF